MWGACELNQTPAIEAKWERENANPSAPYHTYWASKTAQAGAGIALFVSKTHLTDTGKTIYQHPNGKALAVHLSVNATRLLVIVVHVPSGPSQPAFLRNLIAKIPAPEAGRHVILMGDFNFVTNSTIDCIPAEKQKAAESVDALSALSDHLGGLPDAFRIVHPTMPAITHTPDVPNRTERRLDCIYLSMQLVVGAPALTHAEHLQLLLLATSDKRTSKSIRSDHYGVTAKIRFSDIERPPPQWAFRAPRTTATRDAVAKVVADFAPGTTQPAGAHAIAPAPTDGSAPSAADRHSTLAADIQRVSSVH
jgi:endonuclease/exonuclease/phosphatase family metal-dependent hydrolase